MSHNKNNLADPARLAALDHIHLMHSGPEEAFDRFTRLATRLLHVPVALVSLVDVDYQFFKSAIGLSEEWSCGTPISHSFCQHVVTSGEPLVITDARITPLVRDNPAIRDIGVVAYAGVPLTTSAGHVFGSFCAIDHVPREWSNSDLAALRDLAAAVMTEIELREQVRAHTAAMHMLEITRNELEVRVAQRTAELQTANLQLEQHVADQQRIADRLRGSEARLRSVMESATDAIVLADSNSHITFWNPAAEHIFGYAAGEVVGAPLTQIMPPKYRALHTRGFKHAMATGTSQLAGQMLELEGLHKNGTVFPIELSLAMWQIDGQTYFSSIIRDVTTRKQIEDELRRSERDFRNIFEHAHDAILIFDPETEQVLAANQRASMLYGYAHDQFVGMSLKTISQDVDRGRMLVGQLLAGGSATQAELVQFRKDGSLMHLEVNATLVRYQDRPAILSLNRDITERKAFETKLTYLAFHDSLTNLPNRAWLMEYLQQVLARTTPSSAIALLFIDLDRFKTVNDSLGHAVGDELLVGVAQRLQSHLRPDDSIVRVGSDEFVIVLTNVLHTQDVIAVAERITQQAANDPFHVAEHDVYVTASMGVALSRVSTHSAEEVLRDVSNALSRAKSKGKARFEVFDHSMSAPALSRLELEQDLRQALAHDELHIYYQPIVALADQSIRKVEALLRWHHPERGLVSPATFIPLAEEVGLIMSIGTWVLAEACAHVAAWNRSGRFDPPLCVNVNLSAQQFQHANLIETVTSILEATGLEACHLTLEITESVAITDPTFTTATLLQLKQLGVQIAIDDFGTGYSSLSYLKRFPFDTLKIDQSFIAHLPHDADDTTIVQAIITLAHSLRMHVVAEGIETLEQCLVLQTLGCTQGQGYYFARPMSAAAFAALYHRETTSDSAAA